MTDSSSDEKEAMADMAGELIHTKMEMARKDTQMTHVMRIGTFHMEVIPTKDIDIREMFNEMLDKLMKEYGAKLLEISIQQAKSDPESGRHYG
jgi:hypothetical protein|tara:strand:+ start:527 stop:805 length:279 start_codon:yes stop_codon:yes gene_type:complete